jgi:uncharacterized protein YecT (DUF1311 family)
VSFLEIAIRGYRPGNLHHIVGHTKGRAHSMKMLGMICLIMLCSLAFFQKTDEFSDCKKKAQSQPDLQICAAQEAKRVDAQLNSTYQRLIAKAMNDPVAVEKIEASQRAWVVFRDAQLEAMYPHEDNQAEYGTAYPMCVLLLKNDLARQRTRMLSKMLNPVEGEVCDAGLRYQSAPESKPASPNNR